jgi:hypothetical protein
MRASYRQGLLWITENDEPDLYEVDVIEGQVTVMLLADLFGKEPRRVAEAIVRRRKARDANERFVQWGPGA